MLAAMHSNNESIPLDRLRLHARVFSFPAAVYAGSDLPSRRI